jgi:dihydrofolate reductase
MKIIAAINTTVDGIFDHTAGNPDAEVHNHYTSLLSDADVL